MHYKVDELLLLEIATYFSDISPFKRIIDTKAKTIEEYINEFNIDEIIDDKDYANLMNGYDFKNILEAYKNNNRILEAKIYEAHLDDAYGAGGGISVVFINDKLNEAVITFRGTASNEWIDDFVGANQVDSLQQINALEWYKMVYQKLNLENYYVTVIGHSKGGNKAKYITILNDTVNRCVSFDGQGFSDKFFEEYKNQIIKRQDIIENHNIDYDYVNILMNDVGKKTYYVGFDYGRGGFAESHCPNTFFNFYDKGKYNMQINPNGQRPEMQILDQFINSMIRSAINEKERSENNKLVGSLVEKAFQIGAPGNSFQEYVSYLVDMLGDPNYVDNAAYLLTYCIKYSHQNPDFLNALRDIMIHFKSEGVVKIIDMLDDLVNSKKLNALINLSNFLILHVNKIVVKKIQSIAKKKYDVILSKEQIQKVLQVISMTKGMLKTLELNMDGSDIELDKIDLDLEFKLPENLNIVVLAGGLSNERNISLNTGVFVTNVLKEKGHKVILLDSYMGYSDNELMIENAFLDPDKYSLEPNLITDALPDLWAVKKRRMDQSNSYFGPNVLQICRQSDLVFIALHGAEAENGKIQATFDLLGIDYTGCDHFSSAISSNKNVSKQIFIDNGIPVAKGYLIKKGEKIKEPMDNNINYPVIIKPNNGGIGLGITVANDKTAFLKAIKEGFRWDNEVLVEEFITGREFSVGTIDGKALPVLEVLPLKTKEANQGMTLGGEKQKICPANISKELTKKLMETAEKASYILGLKTYSKTDFILKNDGSFICLECDSLPHLNPDSQLVAEANANNISFADFCEKIITISLTK